MKAFCKNKLMNGSSKALFQTAAKIWARMTMQGRQISAQIVTAEEHQQLHFPVWGGLPPLHRCWKNILWSSALFTGESRTLASTPDLCFSPACHQHNHPIMKLWFRVIISKEKSHPESIREAFSHGNTPFLLLELYLNQSSYFSTSPKTFFPLHLSLTLSFSSHFSSPWGLNCTLRGWSWCSTASHADVLEGWFNAQVPQLGLRGCSLRRSFMHLLKLSRGFCSAAHSSMR